MLIKHVALGILGYWSNGFNVLDGVIVIASLVDLGLQYSGTDIFVLICHSAAAAELSDVHIPVSLTLCDQ